MKRNVMRTLSRLALAAACLGGTTSAMAQPAEAQRFLEQRHERVRVVLLRPASDARDAELGSLLGDLLDYEALSRAALADHWEARTPAQRQDFVALLRQLIERSYRSNLQHTLSFDVRYERATAQGDGVRVETLARSRENRRAPAVEIDYQLERRGRTWKVVNLVTDGQDLVANYRTQFHRIIEREGWDGLITRMRARADS